LFFFPFLFAVVLMMRMRGAPSARRDMTLMNAGTSEKGHQRTRQESGSTCQALKIVSAPCIVVSVPPELCFPVAALHLVGIQR
jgi:hypothetical protein